MFKCLFMCDDYYLNVLHEKNNFKLIRKLTVEEYKKFKEASTFMHKLNIKLYFFRMVDYDYNELKNFETSYNDKINYYPLSVDLNEIIFTFFKLLNNYLSSVTLFLNQYQANVKRDYEKKLFDEFNELRNNLHYEHLSYRIIYELQNEVRHSKIPDFTISATRSDSLKPLEAKFYINKNYLNFGKLKNDEKFQELDELIDIYKHMENMNFYLLELAGKILKYELNLHLEYYEFLKSLINEVDIEGEICIIKYNEFDEVKIQPTITFIDKNFIELINKIKMYKEVL